MPQTRLATAAAPHFVLMASIALGGCHLKLVGDYDEHFVSQAEQTQNDIDSFYEGQRRPVAGADTSYDGSRGSYNKIDVDIDGLKTLAGSRPQNDESIKQVTILADDMAKFEEDHRRTGHLAAVTIDTEQDTVRRDISSIIRTENAKKAAN